MGKVSRVEFETNLNGKMSCNRFIHLAAMPEKDISQAQLNATTFEIVTKDNSHPPVKKKLELITEFELGMINPYIIWCSHGMDTVEFYNYLHLKKKMVVNSSLKLGLYYYKDVD